MAEFGDQTFDYIIVGGGSAGCVVASRLSERPQNKVLLLEAGEDFVPGTEPMEIQDTFAATAHSNPRFTWGQTVTFAPRPSNAPDKRKKVRYAQGRVIGGGSSVNGMISVRGLPSDYDGWVERGAAGWGWDDVLPYFKKQETDVDFNGPLHGKDGPITIRRMPKERWPGLTEGFMAAAEEEGLRNLEDENAVFEDGYFPSPVANEDGRRKSAAMGYLTLDVRNRANFNILGEAQVERVLFSGTRVAGVRVHRLGKVFDIKANEVIVSSGALQSPALLLRSGVGPAVELTEHGIEVVADRWGVGKNLMDHPGVNFGCYMKPQYRLPADMRASRYAGLRWSSGLNGCPAGDMYMMPTNQSAWHDIGKRLALLMMWINKSYSTGEVRLIPTNPMAEPDVDFNMCSDERDMERLKIAVRRMTHFKDREPLKERYTDAFPISFSDRARRYANYTLPNKFQTWVGGQLMDASPIMRRLLIRNLIADGPTIEELEADDSVLTEWIHASVLGHYHASCSNRMGAPDDPGAVCDPSARIYGVEGLRVADASIMPAIPCANTGFPTIMVGEKIAGTILAEGNA
jgi:5-(hydroxymethyl)furfural/furfural oxidase